MTAGDRPNLPLASEPVSYLHAEAVTTPLRDGVEPVPASLPLAAEPVLWPSPGHVPAADPGRGAVGPAPRPAPDGGPPETGGALPTTGPGMPGWAGVLAIAAAGVLRTRTRRQPPGGKGPVG